MKPPWLLYGKFARLGTLQDLVDIARRPPKQVFIIWRIGKQSAGLDVLAEGIGGGQLVLDRELRDAAALACQKSVRRHQESVRPIFLRALSRALQRERHIVIRGVEKEILSLTPKYLYARCPVRPCLDQRSRPDP